MGGFGLQFQSRLYTPVSKMKKPQEQNKLKRPVVNSLV